MSKKVVIFGQGELAELAHFYFTNDSGYEVAAFTLDESYIKTTEFCGLPVRPFEDIEAHFPPSEYDMFVSIGYSDVNRNKKVKYLEAKAKGYTLARYISSKAIVFPDMEIGENTFIMEGTTVMPFCKIGANVLIWPNVLLAHHAIAENHITIAPRAAIGSKVLLGERVFIGLGATVRNRVAIGEGAVVGMAANIVSDVPENAVMLGNPAKATGKKASDIQL